MGQYPFRRLQTELANLIASRPDDSRLPSEPELARQMGVSRATLREAMRAFESRGLIRRQQGIGTFKNKVSIIETGLEVLESIAKLAQRIKLKVKVEDLQVAQVEADKEHAAALEVEVGAKLTRVMRVVYTEKRPIAYLVDTLPVDVLSPADLKSDFNGWVLDLLLDRGDPKLVHSLTEINAIGATPDVARALQIQRDDVLLHFKALLYSDSNRVVDYSYSYFLPGYFRFQVVRRVG